VRFMLIRKADKDTEAGAMPSKELLDAMRQYNDDMAKAGVMLQGVGCTRAPKGRVWWRRRKRRSNGSNAGRRLIG
jgi:hypothetical protein